MQDKIVGTTMPVLEINLDPGDRIIAQAGELSWLTSTIECTHPLRQAPTRVSLV